MNRPLQTCSGFTLLLLATRLVNKQTLPSINHSYTAHKHTITSISHKTTQLKAVVGQPTRGSDWSDCGEINHAQVRRKVAAGREGAHNVRVNTVVLRTSLSVKYCTLQNMYQDR